MIWEKENIGTVSGKQKCEEVGVAMLKRVGKLIDRVTFEQRLRSRGGSYPRGFLGWGNIPGRGAMQRC